MSERLVWHSDSPEDEPVATIKTANGEYLLTREDTALFTFLGKLAVYNHIYHCSVVEGEVDTSFYIFSFTMGYKDLVKYMKENKYPQHINMTEVGSCDIDAYLRASLKDLSRADEITKKWEN